MVTFEYKGLNMSKNLIKNHLKFLVRFFKMHLSLITRTSLFIVYRLLKMDELNSA